MALPLFLISGLQVHGQNIVKNGSFEGSPGKRPAGWSWGSRKAKCQFDLDIKDPFAGKCSLHIKNSTPKAPNVFGAANQYIKLVPGVKYKLSVQVKGQGGGLTIKRGRRWRSILKIKPAAEWRTYTRTFQIKDDELAPNGLTLLNIISEDSGEVWLDDLKITAVGNDTPTKDLTFKRKLYKVNQVPGGISGIRSIPGKLQTLALPIAVPGKPSVKKKDFSTEFALGYNDNGLLFFAKVRDDKIRNIPGKGMWVGDSIQIRFDCAAKRSPNAEPTDVEIGFNVDEHGNVGNWCWSGPGKYSGRALSADVISTRAFRIVGGYFLAARIAWKLLHGIEKPENRKFGFSVAFNESDKAGQRKVYCLSSGIHDRKGSDEYFQAMLNTGSPLDWLAIDRKSDHRKLLGSLAAINENGKLNFSAALTDSANQKISKKLATINAKPNDILKIPFEISLDKLNKGDYTVDFMLNGKIIRKLKGCKINLYKKQLAAFAALMKKLEVLNKEFAKFYGRKQYSQYVSIPLFILNDRLPDFQKRLVESSDKPRQDYYAAKAEMIYPGIHDALVDLDARLKLLKSGKSLPGTFKFVSSPVKLVEGWPNAAVINEKGEKNGTPGSI